MCLREEGEDKEVVWFQGTEDKKFSANYKAGEDHWDCGCQVGRRCPIWHSHPMCGRLPWNVSEVVGWGGQSACDLGDSNGCSGWYWLYHISGTLTRNPQKLSSILCPVLHLSITPNCINLAGHTTNKIQFLSRQHDGVKNFISLYLSLYNHALHIYIVIIVSHIFCCVQH